MVVNPILAMCNLQLTLKVFVLMLGYVSTQDSNCDYSEKIQPGRTYHVMNNNYPDNYSPGVQCRWSAECPTGYNCQLDCTDINLPYTTSCTMDRLLISKSGDSQLSGADYYCGKGTLKTKSTGQKLTIGLVTSRDSPGGTFYCKLTAQPASTPDTCSCGYSKTTRIVGGEETGVNEYPSMAGIVLDKSSAQIQCGGTIIDKRYVLTAAHCIINRKVGDMAVIVGEHDVNTGDSPATAGHRVESYIVHPKFDSITFDYDIAIMRTDKDITFGPLVGPVCLPFKYANVDLTGAKLTALGWGTLYIGGPISNVLRKVDLDVISQSQCKTLVPPLTARQFCTYTSGKDACQDDSGGPLLYKEPSNGTLYNLGIISYGQLCATEGNPGINTRVAEFLSWIQSNTQDAVYCRK